jgi:hypothetical protein
MQANDGLCWKLETIIAMRPLFRVQGDADLAMVHFYHIASVYFIGGSVRHAQCLFEDILSGHKKGGTARLSVYCATFIDPRGNRDPY